MKQNFKKEKQIEYYASRNRVVIIKKIKLEFFQLDSDYNFMQK